MSPLLTGVLTILAVLSLSSGTEYVRRGSDITNYSMICHDPDTVLDLYRVCGDEESKLLELWCDTMWSYNRYGPRLHLNTSSGCWTLTGAEKSDSCRYNLWLHNSSGSFLYFTDITVLDPVLITNITSNSSRPGEDIAVSVHFSGEETTVTWEVDGGRVPDRYHVIDDNRTLIIQRAERGDSGRRLSVRIINPVSNETREYQLHITDPEYSRLPFPAVLGGIVIFGVLILHIILVVKCYKKKKLKDVENNDGNDHSEEHGGQNGSSADTDKETTTMWQKILINRIGRLCGNRRYEEAPQMEMEERRRVTPPEVAQI